MHSQAPNSVSSWAALTLSSRQDTRFRRYETWREDIQYCIDGERSELTYSVLVGIAFHIDYCSPALSSRTESRHTRILLHTPLVVCILITFFSQVSVCVFCVNRSLFELGLHKLSLRLVKFLDLRVGNERLNAKECSTNSTNPSQNRSCCNSSNVDQQ